MKTHRLTRLTQNQPLAMPKVSRNGIFQQALRRKSEQPPNMRYFRTERVSTQAAEIASILPLDLHTENTEYQTTGSISVNAGVRAGDGDPANFHAGG